jgi:hypothetical protein
LYKDSNLPRDIPETEFDEIAGSGTSNIDRQIISDDLRSLNDKASKIRYFANKRIAHFDESVFMDFPTFGDLDDCLDFMEELLKKYMLLLHADNSDMLPSSYMIGKRFLDIHGSRTQNN